MKKLLLLLLLINCATTQTKDELPTESSIIPSKTCSEVPPEQRLLCIAGEKKRNSIIDKDAGKIENVTVLEKTAYCQRIQFDVIYGNELEDNLQMKRRHTITICRYDSIADNVKYTAIGFGTGFVAGLVTGVAITK